MRHTLCRLIKQCDDPRGEFGVHSVMDPESIFTVGYEPSLTQLRKMSGHMRLGGTDSMRQFTHAQLLASAQQKHATQPGIVRQGREELGGRYIHLAEYMAGRI